PAREPPSSTRRASTKRRAAVPDRIRHELLAAREKREGETWIGDPKAAGALLGAAAARDLPQRRSILTDGSMWARISGMEDAGPCQPGPRGFEKDECTRRSTNSGAQKRQTAVRRSHRDDSPSR